MRRHDHSPFGTDRFGQAAERFARFFGTPRFIIGQTIIVAAWIAANGWLLTRPFDVFPFILLNLAFSTQAAYAAPLILLAQTRQADRDKTQAAIDAQHREDLAAQQVELINANTLLTERIAGLTEAIHGRVVRDGGDTLGETTNGDDW